MNWSKFKIGFWMGMKITIFFGYFICFNSAFAGTLNAIYNCKLQGFYSPNSKGELKQKKLDKFSADSMEMTVVNLDTSKPKIKCTFSANCSVETSFSITKKTEGSLTTLLLVDQDKLSSDSTVFSLNYTDPKDIAFYYYRIMNPSAHSKDFPIYGEIGFGSCR